MQYVIKTIEKQTESSKKSAIGTTNKYRDITITIKRAAKVYNVLLVNRIRIEAEKVFRKNQNGFRINQSTISQNQTINQKMDKQHAKKMEVPMV